MQRFHNLLVGVELSHGELSAANQQAVRSALWLVRESSSVVTFLSVLPNANSESEQGQALGALSALVHQAEEAGLTVQARTAVGRAEVEILRQIHEGNHDLVLIGSPRANGLVADLFGSMVTRLLDECPCPVWLAVEGSEPAPRNVLIADNLESSAEALKVGVSLPRTVHASLHVLNVVDYPLDHHWSNGDRDELTVRYHQQVRETAEQALRYRLERLSIPSDGLQLHIVGRTGIPDVEIRHFIHEHSIDLVVLGRTPRNGLFSALLGHTADRLLPEVNCSVLVVRPVS